jgi:Beta-1,3-glucanase
MPLLYELKNGATSINTKGLDRSLKELRRAFLSDPIFKILVTPEGILAPGHSIDLGKFPSAYFTNYVAYCWKHWKDNVLTFEYPKGVSWSGQVGADDRLALTGTIGSNPETHYIARPPSVDIFYCNGVFQGVDHEPLIDGYIVRDAALKNNISSALNRTVLHLEPYPTATITEYPWEAYKPPNGSGGKLFHQQNGLTIDNYQTNVYSKILHMFSYDGTIYGFPYDDNAKQASYIDGAATDIILTIGNSQISTIAPVLGLLLD